MIQPGARAAAAATRNRKVGVIGTDATVRTNAYSSAIRSIDNSIEVFSLACPLFVPLVEEGWTEGAVAELTAETYLRDIRKKGIDTLVLGCTHYPLLKGVLSKIMGPGVRLIDSAIETASTIRAALEEQSLLRDVQGDGAGESEREFYVTDSPEKFIDIGERFLGSSISFIKKIELESEV